MGKKRACVDTHLVLETAKGHPALNCTYLIVMEKAWNMPAALVTRVDQQHTHTHTHTAHPHTHTRDDVAVLCVPR